ncbi:hypothetical protein [Roseovarius sp.]|uniref:hypothetical protein n=1 Tax=Roseovarius sp. TaxID=1486281 RepID=UPI003B5C79D2
MILSLVLTLLASAGYAGAALPRTGECVHRENASGVILRTLIKWAGASAEITTTYGETVPGKVVGLRPHDENFKLSIFYEDPISGPAEITIFGVTIDGITTHRRSVVVYGTLQDGTRVVNYVNGFEDITCTVLE